MNERFTIDLCPKTGLPHNYVFDALALGKNKLYEIICCEDCEDASVAWTRILVSGGERK